MATNRLELFQLAVAHASTRPDPSNGLFPAGMLGVDSDGNLSLRSGPASLIDWDGIGTNALSELARSLHGIEGVGDRASTDEVLKEVLRSVVTVLEGKGTSRKELARLESSLIARLGSMVVVLAVGAVDWLGEPRRLSETVLMGRIGEDFEQAVTDLGSEFGITRRFRFDVDSRWPEDMVSMRNDPDIVDDINPWLPTLVAVAVDAVGSTGAYIAHQMTESLLGATWLAKQAGDDWFHLPPWIIGDSVGDDEGTARANEHAVGVFMYWHSNRKPPYGEMSTAGWNYEIEDLITRPVGRVIRVVANSRPFGGTSTGPATRLAAACRHAVLGARLIDPAQRLLHFTSALEALVVGDEANVTETFRRRVARLAAPTAGALAHHRKALGEIYDERSRIVHEGFTRSTLEVMGGRAAEVRTYLIQAALEITSLVEAGMTADAELQTWLDSDSTP